ncbi:MAG: hypothetical protein ACYSUM_10500 [Planctomycetota bacterium]
MTVDPEVLRRYERLDEYGKRLVREIGDLVVDASEKNYRRGQARMRDRAVAAAQSAGAGPEILAVLQAILPEELLS